MNSKKLSPVTFHYMIITGGFWMAFCVVTAYAAVYLKGVGCSNTELGLILALGNVGGALLSPVLGAMIDRNRNLRHAAVVNLLLAVQVALLVMLRLHPSHDLLNAACYVLYITAMMPVNAVNLDLCVRLERAKAPLNFGLARSMGSFSFVILSTLLGVVTAQWGYLSLPFAGLAVVLLQFFGNRLIDRDLRDAEAAMPPSEAVIAEKSSSLSAFIRENKMFCLMLLGTIVIFIAHNMDGNFLINEVEALGGNTAIMGYIAAFTAITEVPVMMFASKLPKKWDTVQYIRLSFVFFVIKALGYALAPTIPLFFAARVLQAPSYALYTVLIVGYADRQVARKDSAKAQSLAFSMTAIGSVLASLIGGPLFDAIDVKPTMLVGAAIAAAGAVIALAGTLKKKAA
ncbi:MAG: MFS transporter [Clostridiales bacterium]|nr:MFS transporter [Clostridiales bacterium]